MNTLAIRIAQHDAAVEAAESNTKALLDALATDLRSIASSTDWETYGRAFAATYAAERNCAMESAAKAFQRWASRVAAAHHITKPQSAKAQAAQARRATTIAASDVAILTSTAVPDDIRHATLSKLTKEAAKGSPSRAARAQEILRNADVVQALKGAKDHAERQEELNRQRKPLQRALEAFAIVENYEGCSLSKSQAARRDAIAAELAAIV